MNRANFMKEPDQTSSPLMRLIKATNLQISIAECHPQDAAQIMSAALEDMAAGCPVSSFVDTQADSDFWAEFATPFELEAYFVSTLQRLGKTALGINARKRLFLSLWEQLEKADRSAFIKKVGASGNFKAGAI